MKTAISFSLVVWCAVALGLMAACKDTPKDKCENFIDKVISCLDSSQFAPRVLADMRKNGVQGCLKGYVEAPDLSDKQFKALSGMTCEDILSVSGIGRISSADMAGGTNVAY